MVIKGIIKKNEYFDSVSLMIVSKEINKIEGVSDSAVVMGTAQNKSILDAAGLMLPEFGSSKDSDLLIAVKATTAAFADAAMDKIAALLKNIRKRSDGGEDFIPKSFDAALKTLPGANLALISVAGKYATREALKALNNGLHVMIFSDNVSVEDEIKLKKFAAKKGLLVMGPDCGTAIINGIPLAFANVVNKGNIGIVAASGTGLQEVSSVIANNGGGISQAIGTGGRDVKKEVGGIMFIEALKALNTDPETKIIVLVSKPPHEDVLKKIAAEIKKIKKPVVAIFIGGDLAIVKHSGAIPATTLEEAGLIATALAAGKELGEIHHTLQERSIAIKKQVAALAKNKTGKYLRGLFSGGTLCDETQLILKKSLGFVYGNAPLNQEFKLKDSWKSKAHTIIDLGEDEFTVGRPHPMIDFSLRNKKILEEAHDKEVAVILLDVVLGYGANLQPAEELAPVIKQAKESAPGLVIICSITGTDLDPQNRLHVIEELEKAGAVVMPSNAAASELVAGIIS